TKDGSERLTYYFRAKGFESLIRRMESSSGTPGAPASSVSAGSSRGSEKLPRAKKSMGAEGGSGALHGAQQQSIFRFAPHSGPSAAGESDADVFFISGPPEVAKIKKEYRGGRVKIGFDLKRILKETWARGGDLAPPYFDLGVAFWLLSPDLKNYEPEFVMKKFLSAAWTGSVEDLKRAYAFARGKLDEHRLLDVFERIEMQTLPVLAEMEAAGVPINPRALGRLETAIEEELSGLTKEIYAKAGEEFNINSPKQVGAVLERLIPAGNGKIRKTPGGQRSTSAESLLMLKNLHPVIPLLLEYRDAFKIQSTYVKPLMELLGSDQRIHTTFVQTGTGTGRLSSQNPNLQNIPRDSRWAKDLRAAVEAPEGCSLVAFDYSQIELRILAALSRDPQMLRAFHDNLDIHRATAAKVFGVPLGEVTAAMRQTAKTLNFGLIYGMGVRAFEETSGLRREEAQKFINTYFAEFSGIRMWQEETKARARMFGYVETPTGRRRYLPNIISGSPRFVAEAERAAINHPIQGFAADLMKIAMVKVREALIEKKLWRAGAAMMLSIHDELLFEVRDSMINATVELVMHTMEHVHQLEVPLKVEVGVGKNWSDLKKREPCIIFYDPPLSS
ncbi:MAG: DNA polymerase, partial [Patescibacteria group bacterium]